ncbi:NUDIX hydrolase [Komagataeibacter sp. FNDCF1]|uniref:NUDIX hydrolase n=1 Tax=Komagataeibacter sp. FNDCF1 TaxID=2878681 RepID=UPI001E3B3778|nr:NUDIX hydrolase [Komagataeibacter sp. FNDCF1]MCE2565870.1 NUDIX hydrolase [Komagataeibacter sp. FNDCF1]
MTAPRTPRWLVWARDLQALAQSGLAYTENPFDRERYDSIMKIAVDMLATGSNADMTRVLELFTGQDGYATPKVVVRAAVFDERGRILLVREVLDHDRWTLPGGWADVNLSPVDNTVKEVREESGYDVRVKRLAAVWDRDRQGHPPGPFSSYTLCFICELTGGAAKTSVETSEIGWFAEDDIPADLSLGRVLPGQIARLFTHMRDAGLPTDFD